MSPRLLFVMVVTLSLLAGCQGVQLKDKQNTLEDALHAYGSTLRWGNVADAYGFLTPELAQQAQVPGNLANIKVTQYQQLSSPVMKDTEASVSVGIRYIHQDRQVERTLTDKQEWRHFEGIGWRRSNPIPEFR